MRSKSSTTTDPLPNPHPGEILLEEFLKPMELSQTALAARDRRAAAAHQRDRLGKRAITADTDLRLARYFAMSEGFFLGLQTDYELMRRRRQIGDQLKTISPGRRRASRAARQGVAPSLARASSAPLCTGSKSSAPAVAGDGAVLVALLSWMSPRLT